MLNPFQPQNLFPEILGQQANTCIHLRKVVDVTTAHRLSSLRLSYDQLRLESAISSAFAVENRWACEILSLQSRGFSNPTFFGRHEAFIATEIMMRRTANERIETFRTLKVQNPSFYFNLFNITKSIRQK